MCVLRKNLANLLITLGSWLLISNFWVIEVVVGYKFPLSSAAPLFIVLILVIVIGKPPFPTLSPR